MYHINKIKFAFKNVAPRKLNKYMQLAFAADSATLLNSIIMKNEVLFLMFCFIYFVFSHF